jgi:formylglycine-generating enzyme required for sulfatase activity
MVAFSTEPGKTASDVGQGSGPYAAALAAELVKPGLDDFNMFHNVRIAVIERTRGDQVPWTEDGIQRRRRVKFGGEGKPVAAPAVTLPEVSEAAREWARVDKTSVAELETFVRRHGASREADYARARIDNLKQQVSVAAPPAPMPAPAKPTQPAVAVPSAPPAGCEGLEALVGNMRRCLKPKDSFRDCPDCPQMVVVPAGDFTMGSPSTEEGRHNHEGPQRRVTLAKPFAVGKFEVTFAEWDACVVERGCRRKPDDSRLGRGRRPVTSVSWDDITNEFLPWLSRKAGKAYRLLTEAEWEYAARAGTTTPFSAGATITTDQANFDGSSTKGQYRKRPVEVGSFQPNAFGLHDMHGNAWEWVQDCYVDTYKDAPMDASAVEWSGCDSRVLRGGSWYLNLPYLRSADRRGSDAISYFHAGLRLARTLSP